MTCTWPAQSWWELTSIWKIFHESILLQSHVLRVKVHYLLGHWVKSPAPANTLLTTAGGSLRKIFFWDFVRNQYDPYWLLTEDIFCETLAHYLSSGSFIPQVGQWHEYFKRGFVYHSVHNIRKKNGPSQRQLLLLIQEFGMTCSCHFYKHSQQGHWSLNDTDWCYGNSLSFVKTFYHSTHNWKSERIDPKQGFTREVLVMLLEKSSF